MSTDAVHHPRLDASTQTISPESHEPGNPTGQTRPPTHRRLTGRYSTLTPETPVLVAALAAMLVGTAANPGLAMLILGVPVAILVGVGTIATAASLLARGTYPPPATE